jgi:hypothetical protein
MPRFLHSAKSRARFDDSKLPPPQRDGTVTVDEAITALTRFGSLASKGGDTWGDARGHSDLNCVSSAFGLRFQHYALSTHHDWTDAYRKRLLAERSAALLAGHTVVITDTTGHAGG